VVENIPRTVSLFMQCPTTLGYKLRYALISCDIFDLLTEDDMNYDIERGGNSSRHELNIQPPVFIRYIGLFMNCFC